MAPQVGFEPTTRRLTVACSTVELLRNENAVHSLPCPPAHTHHDARCDWMKWLPDQDSNLG